MRRKRYRKNRKRQMSRRRRRRRRRKWEDKEKQSENILGKNMRNLCEILTLWNEIFNETQQIG